MDRASEPSHGWSLLARAGREAPGDPPLHPLLLSASVDDYSAAVAGIPLTSAAPDIDGGSASDRRACERWNPSAMPTSTSSERSREVERSEGPQDTWYQVPLCPFASLSSWSLFHGCSVSGSLEHQGKRCVPSGPVPLTLVRAAGVRGQLFRLLIAPSGCTAPSTSVIRPYPHADPPS